MTHRSTQPAGIWVINPGSSTLKWAWFEGPQAKSARVVGQASNADMPAAAAALQEHPAEIAIVRFVHGGNTFTAPAAITADNLPALEALNELAPLHNRHSLACSRWLMREFPALRLIAVFDTEFFHDLPEVAQLYGLPEALCRKYGIRRFGFHGFAHAGMLRAWRECGGRGERVVTLQLGSGCSMAALAGGKPIETTMGFTPNEGLLMSSRCGDIDAGLVTWLQRHEGWSPEETDVQLSSRAGWMGMSGRDASLGALLTHDAPGAARAVALFKHRIRKTLGAYFALLGGIDGIVFSGGIAENNPGLCHDLIDALPHLGIEPGPHPAQAPLPPGGGLCISAPQSRAACWIVSSREHEAILDSVVRAGMAA